MGSIANRSKEEIEGIKNVFDKPVDSTKEELVEMIRRAIRRNQPPPQNSPPSPSGA